MSSEKPNFLVIFSDELDASYLGCYGGNITPTPNVDSLAEEGIRFTNAYAAAPMCTPSRYSLLTGKYPGRCKSPQFLKENPLSEPYCISWNTHVDPSVPTIAKILSNHGYYTGIAGKWHVGGISAEELPKFKISDDPDDEDVNERLKLHQKILTNQIKKTGGFDYAASVLPGNFDGFPVEKLRYHNIEWITEGALAFLEQAARKDQPFFLYVTPTAIHGPSHHLSLEQDVRYTSAGKIEALKKYQPARKAKKKELEGLPSYEKHKKAGLWFLDEQVGTIMRKLKDLGLEENTMVFYMPDHNVEPGKATCYEKGLKVPLIMRWPGRIREGIVTDALVQTVDVLPTVLDAAHVDVQSQTRFDGVSLVPLVERKTSKVRDFVYFESGYARAITNGEYKYIAFRYPESILRKMETGVIDYAPDYLGLRKQPHSCIAIKHYPHYFDPDQLYDLKSDPYEQCNLADNPKYEQVLREMKSKMREILSSFEHTYNLEVPAFMKTEKFLSLVQETKSIKTDWIPWLKRDHGEITWPPATT